MKEPPIIFSRWVLWSERKTINNAEAPGVYLLAHLENPQAGLATDPLTPEIIYIGETCRSLSKRWQQFDKSAFTGKSGHSGGHTYRRLFSKKNFALFVAAFPVVEECPLRHLYIRFVERKILWDFAKKFGRAPICNRK